jgi:hypothetical protein
MQRNIEGYSPAAVDYVQSGLVIFGIALGPPAFLLGIWMNAHPWRVALALSWPLVVSNGVVTLMGCPISPRCGQYEIGALLAGVLLPSLIVVGLAGVARLPATFRRLVEQPAVAPSGLHGPPTTNQQEEASPWRGSAEWLVARDRIRRRAIRQMEIGGTAAGMILILNVISYSLSLDAPYGQFWFLFIVAASYGYRGKQTYDGADARADTSAADTHVPPI